MVDYHNRYLPWTFAIVFVGLVCFVTVISVIVNTQKSPPKTPFVEVLGGIYNETVDIAFVHDYEVGLVYTALGAISNGCTPPTTPFVDPIYNILKLGTLSDTTSSWHQLKSHINGTGSGQCIFYGLDAMKIRTDLEEGVADICQGYMTAGLQYFIANKMTPQQQNDLSTNLFNAVLVAYPLNIYWKNTLGANWITDVVLTGGTGLQAEIQAAHDTFHAGGNINVRAIVTRFCNQYFATDQLAYYNPQLMVHLGFGAEGMINKRAQTDSSPDTQLLLGRMVIPEGLDFKHVYVIDPASSPGGSNGMSTDPVYQLFLQSMIPDSVPVEVVTADVIEALNTITTSILNVVNGFPIIGSINASMVPVLVLGRYVDDIQTYQSFKVPPKTIFFAFSQEDPNNLLGGEYLGSLLQNAASQASVNIWDSLTMFPFEQTQLGEDYRIQSQVSDIINNLIGSQVYAGSTDAWDVLDTFAMKNTLVGGVDVGERLTIESAMRQMELDGVATGLHRHPFAMELIQTVTTPSVLPNQTTSSGFFGLFGGGGGSSTVEGEFGANGELNLPIRLDWRQKAPACITPTQDQGSCNNCWAIASSATIGGRLCITGGVTTTSGSARRFFLSTQQITACSKGVVTTTDGCNPQQPSAGFTFMSGDMTTRECMSEVFRGKSTNGGCPRTCKDGRAPPRAGGVIRGTYTQLQTARDIKAALLSGPVAIGISFPVNFFSAFPVCSPVPESFIFPVSDGMTFIKPGGHMMTLWGYDDTTSPPSWIIQNSHGCSSSGDRDNLIQGNRGFIRLAQDVNGVLKGRAFWVDYNGYVADVRTAPTDPSAVISNLATTTTTSSTSTSSASLNSLINSGTPAASVTKTFTATTYCPNSIVNTKQAAGQSSIQGCPGSVDNLVLKSDGAELKPGLTVLVFIVFMLLLTVLVLN